MVLGAPETPQNRSKGPLWRPRAPQGPFRKEGAALERSQGPPPVTQSSSSVSLDLLPGRVAATCGDFGGVEEC